MKHRFIRTTLSFFFLLLLLAGKTAYAFPVDEIIWEQDENFEKVLSAVNIDVEDALSAYVRFTSFTAETFSFYLTNSSYYSDPELWNFPSTVMLTGFGFNLPPGYLIKEGTIFGANQISEFVTWNNYWGYDNIRGNDGGPFVEKVLGGSVNSAVATLSAAVDLPLDNNTANGWQGAINGPNHGILNPLESANNWDYFQSDAFITLWYEGSGYSPTELRGFIESSYTVASFGSPQLAAVPEPATLLLLGFGLVGLAGVKRSRLRN